MYEEKVKYNGGNKLTKEADDNGDIILEDVEFTYPTKKEI